MGTSSPKRHLRRWILQWLRRIRILTVCFILLIVLFLAYLHFYGLPGGMKTAFQEELARRGVAIEMQSLHLDLIQGVLARNVSYEIRPGQQLQIRDVAIGIRWWNLIRKKFTFDSLDIDGWDLTLQSDPHSPPLHIRHVSGGIRFSGPGILNLDDMTAEMAPLELHLSGRLDLNRTAPATSSAPPSKPFQWDGIQRQIQRLTTSRSQDVLALRIQFDAKPSEPGSIRARGSLSGKNLRWDETWKLDSILGEIRIENRAVYLEPLEIVSDQGKLHFQGSFSTETGWLTFQMRSGVNPMSFFASSWIRTDQLALRNWTFRQSPELWLKGQMDLSPQGGWKTLNGEVSFECHDLSWRDHDFKEVRGHGTLQDGVLHLPDLAILRSFGRLDADVRFDLEKKKLDFDCASTLDFSEVMMILYPSDRNWFRTVDFQDPPLLKLKGSWAIEDPNGLKATGIMDWKRWSSREVTVKSSKAKLEILGRRFAFSGLELVRDEGRAFGDMTFDFAAQTVELHLDTHLHFSELSRFIGSKIEQTFKPYVFPDAPEIRLDGLVDLDGDRNYDLHAVVKAPTFRIWQFAGENVQCHIHYHRKAFEIAQFESDFYDGKLRGDALFDFSTPDQDWAFHCNVEKADFDRFTHDLWDYDEVRGYLTGWANMSGHMTDSKVLKGEGEARIDDGVLWKIPLFGELSKFIPILGVQKATKGTAHFTVSEEKAHVDEMHISAGIMSLTAKGDYQFDKSLDFIVQGHFLRAFFGIGYLMDPFTKAFEYHLGGKLNARIWKPRYLPRELLLQFGEQQPTVEPSNEPVPENHVPPSS